MEMNYLKFYRLKKGLSMQEVADSIGVSVAKYRTIEIGGQTASDEVVQKIASKLEVSKEMLFHPVKYTIREMEGDVFL
jgi:transcriptional regulator with XRE-family HTH domain